MIPGGKGGANTQSGLHFEKRTDLATAIGKLPGFTVQGKEILKNGEVVAINCKKKALAKFLQSKEIKYQDIVSRMLEPDEALYMPAQNKMYVIEMKFQGTEGSVDEKLQTCDFKKKQYQRLLEPLNADVEYIYLLNDWFLNKKYKDVLNYVEASGCKYFFNTLPLEVLGL